MKRIFLTVFTMAVLASLVLSACAPAADTPAPQPTAPSAEQPSATEETAPQPKEVTLTIGFTSSLTGAQDRPDRFGRLSMTICYTATTGPPARPSPVWPNAMSIRKIFGPSPSLSERAFNSMMDGET